jgi:hypothetical protein
MNVNRDVREQLILSRWLLAKPDWQGSAVPESVRVQHDLIVAYGATELAVAAICVELDCLPDKKDPCLPDYFNSLARAVHLAASEPGADYIAELHTVRSASQLRFRPPDPGRWTRPKEEALEYITRWCQQCLGLSLMDLDPAPT